mgnify:CR=1 FL=1
MSSHDTHDLQKSVRRYLFVFYALIAGTVITVGAYYVHIPSVALTIAVAMFIVGALLITVSGVKEDYKQKGKDLMIGSVISLGVVSGAYVILTLVDRFLS